VQLGVKQNRIIFGRVILLILIIASKSLFCQDEIGKSVELSRYFSPILKTEQISFQSGFTVFQLRSGNILNNSEKVYKIDVIEGEKEKKLFERNVDYQLDYETGVISFPSYMLEQETIEIEYSRIPEEINRQFYYFVTSEYSDSLQVQTAVGDRFRLGFTDTELNITGSKTFSVSVGSDEDFNIHQSLFLRIDGELRRNLRIRAQLSDSQSPLTPEGDTRELSSLDQIYIMLYGNEYELAFGDLEISFEDTQFINFTSRFEGVKGEWYGQNRFQGALAISKGKQSSNEFFGNEGKQGPYFITVANVGTSVQVIPGSEEVFLNGVALSRGTDYTIDYAAGSVSFTSRHFINSNSLIYIKFQYSDEDYRQNMYFNSSRVQLLPKLTLNHHMIIQNDDRNNPLQESFTPDDREILKEAGDDPAWTEGVIEVETGEGLYVKVIEADLEYYRYVGPNAGGEYIIHFTYVGQGEGDYRQVTPNSFEYAGPNQGSWIPMRLLPSPQFQANYDVGLRWDGDFYEMMGESIFSRFDRNTFSSLDSSDNDGYGLHWQMRMYPDFSRINPNWMVYYRHLSENLHTFSDIRDPELNYDFYEITEADDVAVDEAGTTLSFNIENFFLPRVRYMRKRGRESYQLDNLTFNTTINQYFLVPTMNYRYSYARQDIETPVEQELLIEQNQIDSNYILGNFRLAGDYQYRTFNDKYSGEETDTEETGTRYRKRGLSFGTYQTSRIAGNLFIDQEFNDLLNEGWERMRESVTLGGEGFLDLSEQRFRAAYSHREVKQLPDGGDSTYDMAEVNTNNSLLNRGVSLFANYALKNVEFYPYVRELIFVGEGAGIYDSTGVVSEDGEYDYIMVQVGDSEMSIEINADLMLNLTPRLFISETEEDEQQKDFISTIKRWLSRIQTESYFLVMENSRSDQKWDVYFLKPDLLMNEESTIYGRNQFRQTAWLDLVQGRVLAKMGYNRDRTLDNRYQDQYRTDIRANELMFRFSRFFGADYELTYEKRSEEESRYESRTESDIYSLDIRNRFGNNLQIGSLLKYSTESGDSTLGGDFFGLSSYSITETVTYFFQRRYRLLSRLEYRRNERDGSGFLSFLPEKRAGNIFRWSVRLNYQLNPFITGGFEYSGNKYPLQDTVHQLKVEARAEF